MYERSNRGSYSKTISIRQVQYVLYRKPYMIYSPFYIKYLYLNILSAASVPRPHSTSNLLSTCHVLAWGSGPSKQTWPLAPCPDRCSVGAFAGWLVQCGIVGTISYAVFSCIPDCLVWGIQELGTCLGVVFVEKTGCFCCCVVLFYFWVHLGGFGRSWLKVGVGLKLQKPLLSADPALRHRMARTRQPWAGQSLGPPGHLLGLGRGHPGHWTSWPDSQGRGRPSHQWGSGQGHHQMGQWTWTVEVVGGGGSGSRISWNHIEGCSPTCASQEGVSGDLREVLVDSVSLAFPWLWSSPPLLVLQESHLGHAFCRFGKK